MTDWIPESHYRLVDPDETYEGLPMLVVGVASWDARQRPMAFAEPDKWVYLCQQCAGHGVNHLWLQCRVLKPKPAMLQRMKEIDERWFDSDEGAWSAPHLSTILEYRKQLSEIQFPRWKFDLDCNRSYHWFREAVYPMDCFTGALSAVCEDKIPDDFDYWCEGFKPPTWSCFILGRNCD